MKPQISVIIPTWNRQTILKKCLGALRGNKFNKPYEVIIVDDGSTDNTYTEISKFIKKAKLTNYYIFRQNNSGPAKARNLGIEKAKGNILLFIGDDSIAEQNLLEQHYFWNTKRYPQENIGILGLSKWSPEIEITPFMRWIDSSGLQFSYHRLINENSSNWRDFWTCNVSVKRKFLIKYGVFDEQFSGAAWEDIELAWRLSKHNFQIKYDQDAIVKHYHPTTLASLKKRMLIHGYAQKLLAEKMGKDYSNNFFNQPLKALADAVDLIITYSGILFIFDKIATWLEKRMIIPVVFYPVLWHYKHQGNNNYEAAHS